MSACECRSHRTCARCLNPPVEALSVAVGAAEDTPTIGPGVVTPSGVEILFEAEPKRRYLLRQPEIRVKVEGGSFEPITRDWQEVPSVTNVLGVLDKPALPWWGMKVGVEGVLELLDRGVVWADADYSATRGVAALTDEAGYDLDVEALVGKLAAHKLTVNHQRDKAGARGVSVHDGLEQWAFLGHLPDPADYPPEEFGYVAALRTLLDTILFEPEAAEVMVGSLEHGFAGRYDLRAKLGTETEVQVSPRRKVTLPVGSYLCDLKSSKSIYKSHSLQLAAYEAASVECGYKPTDYRLVIQVGQDGTFDLRFSEATTEDFLAVLAVHQTMQKKLLR